MLENHSIINFILKYGIKTEDGTPYTFDKHMFMFDVLREMARADKNLVIYKAAQIGFSTAAIISSFWISRNRGLDIIYTLPTSDDVKQFAGGKINRIIAQNPILQEWVREKDTVEQKTVGDNIIYYRGTWTSKAAMMVSSDLNIYDEVDASNQEVIEQYSTRLQASETKLEWFFSHPSVPGNGVSKHWEKSDQKHWFITCPHCKEEQFMSYPESINVERECYVCKYCDGELSNRDRAKGRWVAKFKDRPYSGYWIPLFICPWVPAKQIIEYRRDKSDEYFWNKVLGLPYVGANNKLTYDLFTQNLTSKQNEGTGRIVIGVDTGLPIWYVIGNKEGIFYWGKCDDYDELENLLKRWKDAILVADQGGDLIGIRKLREKYPGRVFLCHYRPDRKTYQLIQWGSKDEFGNVVVDRNRMIQLLVDEYTQTKIPVFGTESDWHTYWLHWNNIFRIKEEDTLGIPRYKWERSGDDHLVHSTVYWRVGMSKFGGTGNISTPDSKLAPNSYTLNPDDTVSFNPVTFYKQESNDDWRAI